MQISQSNYTIMKIIMIPISDFQELRKHNVIWKTMRTPVLEFFMNINID